MSRRLSCILSIVSFHAFVRLSRSLLLNSRQANREIEAFLQRRAVTQEKARLAQKEELRKKVQEDARRAAEEATAKSAEVQRRLMELQQQEAELTAREAELKSRQQTLGIDST
ncbi:unnamed protein product [Phaeothamnion confervicola]